MKNEKIYMVCGSENIGEPDHYNVKAFNDKDMAVGYAIEAKKEAERLLNMALCAEETFNKFDMRNSNKSFRMSYFVETIDILSEY